MTQASEENKLFPDAKGFTAKNYADLLERFKSHATEIGHIAYAWNSIHVALGDVFEDMLRTQPHGSAKIVWDTLRSDRMQREVSAAVAKIALKNHSKHLEEFLWLLTAIEGLSIDRNDSIHSAYMFKPIANMQFSVIPHPGGDIKRVQRMKDKELLREFQLYRDELHALRIFTLGISSQIHSAIFARAIYSSMPKRPLLRSSVSTKKSTAKRHQGATK